MTVWFDVEDLFHYFRGGHKRISGIQRLTFEIYRAAHTLEPGGVGFVRHGHGPDRYVVVDWDWIADAFADAVAPGVEDAADAELAEPEADAEAGAAEHSAARRAARRIANRLPPRLRGPLVLAGVMQVQAVVELARFTVRLLRRAVAGRPRRAPASRPSCPAPEHVAADSFTALARPGDTLLVLGSPWFRAEYSQLARWLRDERRMRFGVLVHDLVPIRRPEWCHVGVTRTFKDWYADVLPFCDVVLANSRHTAADVEAYATEIGVALPGPVRAVPVGTGFGPAVAAPAATAALAATAAPGNYVLFVSTMEARKNHALAVRVWRRLLDEERAGLRPPGSVPELVFAGRVGWLVADLVQQLENTAWLGGRVRMVENPSDTALRALYAGCLFTLFPSLHEGWGLPVTESLALGAPCLSSDAGALPEAGGALCRYFDPEDVGSAHRALAALLDDRPALEAWRAQVRRDFRPTPWSATARAVLDAA